MILFQIGAAPVMPEARVWLIGELSLLPTQTATKSWGVKPKVQLSRLLSEVPVLTETVVVGNIQRGTHAKLQKRALLSAKMLEIM